MTSLLGGDKMDIVLRG